MKKTTENNKQTNTKNCGGRNSEKNVKNCGGRNGKTKDCK